ncbi:MAG: hypothetical protein ACM3ML_03445 [Micromonosporaceae bacterium]
MTGPLGNWVNAWRRVPLVADLMREMGLRACQPQAYKRTTLPGEQPVATRMVTGWQLAADMRTSLVTDALAMAITHPA